MRMFKGPREPLHASLIRFFGLLSKVDGKLSKSEIRNLMLPMKMNLKTKKLCSPKCTDNKITFASIWTFKLIVPSNQTLFKLSFIVTEWFCIHSNVQVLVSVDITEETFPCFSFFDVNPGPLIFLAGTQRLDFLNSKP